MHPQISTAEILSHVSLLMAHSSLHRKWYIEDLFRLILPPIQLGQAVYHVENDRLVGFATMAFMTPDKAKAFIRRQHRLQPEDFCCGDIPVVVDGIAPFGHIRKVTRKLRDALTHRGYKGKPVLFRRDYGDKSRPTEVVV
jgi:cytolysin-activating lysine-acyltransferase